MLKRHEDTAGLTLVVGGCHVSCHLVGKDLSFPSFLQEIGELPEESDCVLIPTVSAKAASRRIGDVLRTHRVSRVILQIGHYETVRACRYSLPWRRQEASASGASERKPKNSPEPRASSIVPAETKKISLRMYVRSLLGGRAIHWLGFDREALTDPDFEKSFDGAVSNLLDYLQSAGITNIVLLSCFPAANHRVNYMRQIANRILVERARRVGLPYVDLWPALSFQSGPLRGVARPGVLADSGHLNVDGHRIVAHEIASVLSSRRRLSQ